MEILSARVVQYHNEDEALKEEVTRFTEQYQGVSEKLTAITEQLTAVTEQYHGVTNELTAVKVRLDAVIRPISGRQLATNADYAAMDAIFPQCRKKPYCLRSYSNLMSFLSDPKSDMFTGPLAPESWLKLDEVERTAIQSNAKQFIIHNPFLKSSIDTLKSECWRLAHNITTLQDTLNFLRGDEVAYEAVRTCADFLCLTSASDEATEKDGWNSYYRHDIFVLSFHR
jgi:hypothetical protein